METQSLIVDLCLLSATGAFMSIVAKALRLPAIVGYMFAGYLIGPNSPFSFDLISDSDRVQSFAELGMILLIFTVGLEMGFRKLRGIGFAPYAIGFVESLGVWGLGTLVAVSLGYSAAVAQFIGAMLAISSTTITLIVLKAKGLSTAKYAESLVGILLVEDLVAILMLVYLPALASGSIDTNVGQVILQLIGSLVLWWFAGTILSPRVVAAADKLGGDELLLLTSLGLCLGLAVLAVTLNLSSALGAFMMGAILADCRQNRRIEALMKPLRQIFGVLFFVSFGMLFNPRELSGHWGIFFSFLATLLFGKFLITTAMALVAGKELRDALRMGGSIAQIGEFAFVIGGIGMSAGVLPPEIFSVICATSIVTITLTPMNVSLTNRYADVIATAVPQKLSNLHKSYVQALRTLMMYGTRVPRHGVGPIRSYTQLFSEKLRQNYRDLTQSTTSATLDRLAPWDEYLSEIVVAAGSDFEGRSLLEIDARGTFSVNVVAVERDQFTQISPEPNLRILPNDVLLVYGLEENITHFADVCRTSRQRGKKARNVTLQECDLRAFKLAPEHPMAGKSLRDLNIREASACTILAVVRDGTRIKNPRSDFRLLPEDEIFVVGPRSSLERL